MKVARVLQMLPVVVMMISLALGIGAATAATPLDATTCASCHASPTARWDATGGHSDLLDCASCHADRRPGRIGARHRKVANCASCHETSGHPSTGKPRRGRKATRNCLVCHDPHGAPNRKLIRESLLWRRRVVSVVFTSDAGATPAGFTHPDAPGTGLCEVCHRSTDFYTRDGNGAAHFTERCTLCHDHAAHFGVVVTPEACATCHATQATNLAKPSRHAAFDCATCHETAQPLPGPGHQTKPACETCHPTPATHAPSSHGALPCAQCHDPHGSDNHFLVRTELVTTAGARVAIRFDDPEGGRADGSFASATTPGSGICEVCHTATDFYRADGSGAAHYTFSCLPCHRHAKGFAPQ